MYQALVLLVQKVYHMALARHGDYANIKDVLNSNKQSNLKLSAQAITRRHHFSTSNTVEIIVTLLFLSIITRLIALLSRDAKY